MRIHVASAVILSVLVPGSGISLLKAKDIGEDESQDMGVSLVLDMIKANDVPDTEDETDRPNLLREHKVGNQSKPATAEVFVINMKKRTDRLKCAMDMISGSPYNVSRFEAVTPKTLHRDCPYLKHVELRGGQDNGGENAQSVMCSNYKLWEQQLNQDADFLIVFEDDIAVSRDMWDRVQDILNDECQNWDYIAVDTFHVSDQGRMEAKPKGNPRCAKVSKGVDLGRLTGTGAQMQIFRRTALGKMMQIASGVKKNLKLPIDNLNKRFNEGRNDLGVRAAMFQGHIAAQYKSAALQGVHKKTKCSGSVVRSNIQR